MPIYFIYKSIIKHILLFFLVILFSSCFKSYKGRIQIDGSSTVYPITEAVAEEYRSIQPDIRITVGVSGTGGGLKNLQGAKPISAMHRGL